MTVVDPRSRIPPLDAAALEALTRALDREGVVAGMLIGSQARASAGPLSDVDLGVWHEPDLSQSARLALRLELAACACRALGTDDVDIVMLNSATPLMRHRAVRDARRPIERNARTRVRLETRAILDYLDTKPLRAELARGQRHRFAREQAGRARPV